VLPVAAHVGEVAAAADGFVTRLDALAVGIAAWRLGAGRARKEDDVDAAAGVVCLAKPGDRVRAGEPILELHTSDPSTIEEAAASLEEAIDIGPDAPAEEQIVVERIG
jgi:thymidine phosphorylase